jgi:hypothetical protein
VTEARRRPARLPRPYIGIVLINYLVQVPYALDLYGPSVNRAGVLLLAATLAWLLAACGLWLAGRRAGYWLLLAYVVTQVAFYGLTDVAASLVGSGLPAQLTHARDGIVLAAFVAGAANLVAAVATLPWLLLRRRTILASMRR